MGIPSFFRWLSERFPHCIVDAVKAESSKNKENGVKFDNLYLDMNGIIHPCFHPEEKPAPKSYEQIFESIFSYMDKMFSIVRPRKLLYLAIDGVAPRAKMNQQRSRRFRAAKDAAEEATMKTRGQKKAAEEKGEAFDSNVITPGTEFMALLSTALRYYICSRINDARGWKGVKVILSDSSVPGEGEHKIMSYIRLQRNLPGYDPNTRHCMYGLDADLIMLALTTHEIHFSILRENVQKPPPPKYSARKTHWAPKKVNTPAKGQPEEVKFQFLHVWILREYLQYSLKIPDQIGSVDLERLIDDFVFMCLFVGNDFLPHMPLLEISKGAIDMLMEIYKKEFVRMGGYLTNSCEVNLVRVQHFLHTLADHEADILRRSHMENEASEKRINSKSSRKMKGGKRRVGVDSVKSSSMEIQAPNGFDSVTNHTVVDKIKFRDSLKVRYYADKFEVGTEEDRERMRSDVVLKYIEGMCWVMHYYYGGVCSWQWFYPYHYAPFASDFRDIEKFEIQFTLGEPFKPFDQLMAVLPAASGHAVPLSYRKLMTDPSSPLLPFYPQDFELDLNGKRFSWQAVCKLPFIEESFLLSEIRKVEDTLTDEERQRNSLGLDKLFIHSSHSLAKEIVSFFERNVGDPELANSKLEQLINPELSDGMNGYIVISDKHVHPTTIDSPIPTLQTIENNKTLSVFYKFPPFHAHIPRLPEGVQLPRKTIRKKHIRPTPLLWHESSAVVGRLHSIRPIPNSISGPLLSKWAHRNVLAWYRGLPEERKQYQKWSEAVEPGPKQYPKWSEVVEPGSKQYPKRSEAVEPGPKQYPKWSEVVERGSKQYPKRSEAVEPGPKQYPKRSEAVEPGPKQYPKRSKAVEPGSTPLPSGSSVSKKRKREQEVVANEPGSTQLLPLGKRVTTKPKIVKQKVTKPVSLLLRSGNSVFVEQRGEKKVIVIIEPADSDTRVDEPASVAKKSEENNCSDLCDTKMVTIDLNSVSSVAPIVATSAAGVDNQPKEQNNGSELCDTIGVINEPVSTPLPGGNSVPEKPKIMENEVVAKDMQIDEPVSVAKSEEKNGCDLVLDGDLRNNLMGVTNEPVSTLLPSGNSAPKKQRRKRKAIVIIEPADSGTQVDEPTSVAKRSEEDNCSQLCDTKTVTNNPDSVSSVAPIVSTSTATNEQNNVSQLCDTIGVTNEPVSTLLPSGNMPKKNVVVVPNGIVTISSTKVDEPVSVPKSEASLSVATSEGDNLPKAQNNDSKLSIEPISVAKLEDNGFSEITNKPESVSGVIPALPISKSKKRKRGIKKAVANETVTVSAAENEDGNRPKEQSNGTEFFETVVVADGTSRSDSVTLPSGDSTTRKRQRIRKTKQSIGSGVGENPLSPHLCIVEKSGTGSEEKDGAVRVCGTETVKESSEQAIAIQIETPS